MKARARPNRYDGGGPGSTSDSGDELERALGADGPSNKDAAWALVPAAPTWYLRAA